MPVPGIDWNTEATWNDLYQVQRDDGQPGWVGFERAGMRHITSLSNAAGIVAALNLNANSKILIVGAGYGWMANDIAGLTGATVCAVDTSTYIQTRKAQNADIEILNADVSTGSGRSAIRQALGISGNSKASHAITEDIITCATDAECTQLSTYLHNLADVVVHWTTMLNQGHGQDPRLNWKTVAQWKALLPNDLFIQRSGNVVL